MNYKGRHVRPNTGWWAVISWLLAIVFFGSSCYYGMYSNVLSWAVWFVIFMAWTYIAITTTVRYFKERRS